MNRQLENFLTLSLCLFALQRFALAVDFLPALNSAAGNAPVFEATGDFNGDGKPDLAVVNADGVSILLGTGDGKFGVPALYSAGKQPSSVTIGDFNRDGKLDLVVTNSSSNNVSILLGNGDGTFSTANNFAVGANPQRIVARDFNRDGKLDLIIANQDGISVSLLIGNGDGTFQSATNFSVIAVPDAIAVGDFNADGKLDVAVASASNPIVSVLLGNGDGTFRPMANVFTIRGETLAVGDFNADGIPDLVVANRSASDANVLLGNGDGTFQSGIAVPVGTNVISIDVADFNADGKADLAVAHFYPSDSVSVLLGNGNATFQPPADFVMGMTPLFISTADFNGDGKPDLAVVNQNSISVFLNNVLAPTPPFSVSFLNPVKFSVRTSPSAIATADFNLDGKPDFAVANTQSNNISVVVNKSDGAFQAAVNYSVGSAPVWIAAGDFDGDGKVDLIVANNSSNDLSVLLGNGDGTFARAAGVALSAAPVSIWVGDINRDGKLDVIVIESTSATRLAHTATILLGNGDGTFKSLGDLSGVGSVPIAVAIADFNQDGNPDLAVVNNVPIGSGSVSILLGDGQGGFGPASSYTTGIDSDPIAVGDFNGDGKVDIAVGNLGPRTVSILLGNGDGTLQPDAEYSTGGQGQSMVAGDFNGDGKLDLAVADFGGEASSVSVVMGNGDGTFGSHIDFAAGLTITALVAGDFNSDGELDIAVVDQANNDVKLLLNSGGATLNISSSNSSSNFGDSVTFTATVAHLLGTGAPTGTVTLEESGQALGAPVLLDSTGTARLTLSTLSGGTHRIVSLYSGDASFYPNTGAGLTQTILPIPITTLSVNALAFGNQGVGSISTTQSFNLTNAGDATLSITSIIVSGEFAQTSTCGFGVSAGAACTISVVFKPTAPGSASGTLTITDNSPGSPHTVTLAGVGVGPTVSLSVSSLTFGPELVATTSAPQTVTLINSGNVPLSVASIGISGDFAQSNVCGQSLTAGASCAFGITYAPKSSGTGSGTLTIKDNAPGSPHLVTLSGTGTDFLIAVPTGSSSSTTVTAGQTAIYNLLLSPLSGFNGNVSLSCTGAPNLAACSVSPLSTTVSAAVPISVNVTTTANTQVAGSIEQPSIQFGNPAAGVFAIFALACTVSMCYLIITSRRLRTTIRCIGLVVALMSFFACGGGNQHTSTGSPGTSRGTYTLVVTGISNGVNHTLNLQLTVN